MFLAGAGVVGKLTKGWSRGKVLAGAWARCGGSWSLTSWNSPKVAASGTASMLGKSRASIVRDLMLESRGANGIGV